MPLAPWLKALELTAAKLRSGVAIDVSLEEVGREMFRGFTQGVVGKAMLLVMKQQLQDHRQRDEGDHARASSAGAACPRPRGLLREALAQLFVAPPGGGEVFTVKW